MSMQMVKMNVTVAVAAPTAGILHNLPVGTHTLYVDLSKVNYAADGLCGGTLDSATPQYLTDGAVSGNVTYNWIKLVNMESNNDGSYPQK